MIDESGKAHCLSFDEKGLKNYKELSSDEKEDIQQNSWDANGAALNFEDELSHVIGNLMETNSKLGDVPVKVKVSGDGAKMTRLTNFIVISFSVLNLEETVMSSKGNHTVAVIKGHEDYHLLRTSCAKIFSCINRLVKSGKINIKGKDVPVEFYLGGDYKFLLLVLGMKGATSDYACIWCKIFKLDRCDMSRLQNYWETQHGRSIEDIKECALKGHFSCQFQPLLNIKLENVVLDELHLMLRITDVLTKSLINQALEWDIKDNIPKAPKNRSNQHLTDLVRSINECGVTFNVWEKKNADGKGSGVYDFTSLMGADKKLLLKHLPEKLKNCIEATHSDAVISLWKDFSHIYQMVNEPNPSASHIDELFKQASAWVKLFVSLSGVVEGCGKKQITPYMHCLVYHVPNFMQKHGGIKKFTGQGVEKKNDDVRKFHLTKSNKWDAPKNVLLVGKRLQVTSEQERTTRSYYKRNIDYWSHEIKEARSKRRRKLLYSPSSCPASQESNAEDTLDVESLSIAEIKEKLKELGVQTRVRKLEKLKYILQKALQD
ncbi:uncharacterized protein LOC114533075 [Dendronephthya gigantea]|uniref:uncharacterized protein LOC114533075 n=1 Tax=Dendronephthya gigantea TaxID=151771 RepID=UPI00106D6451|nr:uncharacterized protein LOC114533075 [Dendronephthya gigantea]